ncbi:MAG: hypothetical protein IJV40_11325 [Oscillospiraceae bacterium]|nr:hypothetical protein [Oscillospiraceae bacterium]
MKIRITDLVLDCCPEYIDMGEYNDELATRIIDKVQVHLRAKNQSHRIRKVPRIFLIAAMLALAFGTVAFAIAEYTISLRKPSVDEELVSGFRYEEVVDGKVWNSQILTYPDAGMVFTFTCPEEMTHTPEFRCFWLPQEATEGITDEQGWTKRLFCDSGDIIPYCISTIDSISNGLQLVLSGNVSVVKEERLGDWELLEVTSDYSELIYPTYNRANYILLFQKTTGYLVMISGELDMETLEHIACEMEIRESGTPKVEHTGGPLIGTIDLGRG